MEYYPILVIHSQAQNEDMCLIAVGLEEFRKLFSSNLITPAVFSMLIALRDIMKLISSQTSMTTLSKNGFPLSAC